MSSRSLILGWKSPLPDEQAVTAFYLFLLDCPTTVLNLAPPCGHLFMWKKGSVAARLSLPGYLVCKCWELARLIPPFPGRATWSSFPDWDRHLRELPKVLYYLQQYSQLWSFIGTPLWGVLLSTMDTSVRVGPCYSQFTFHSPWGCHLLKTDS